MVKTPRFHCQGTKIPRATGRGGEKKEKENPRKVVSRKTNTNNLIDILKKKHSGCHVGKGWWPRVKVS